MARVMLCGAEALAFGSPNFTIIGLQMKFLFGIALGALGVWAYQNGKLEMLTGRTPEQIQQAFNSVGGASTSPSPIVTPTAAEVTGRPNEPLPS